MRIMGVTWTRFVTPVGLIALVAGCGPATAPPQPATATTAAGLCAEVHGGWDGAKKNCSLVVTNAKHAQLKITAAYPVNLVNTPVVGPILSDYIRKFFTDFGHYDDSYVRNSEATVSYQAYEHAPDVKSVLFKAFWFFAGAAHPGDRIATFTFDLKQGKQLQLADLFCDGTDPNTALPPLARPYLQIGLEKINGQQPPGTTPLEASDFEPNQPGARRHRTYVESYNTWVLDGDSLVPVLPAERDGPVSAGLLQPRIPLSALHSILRNSGCSA